GRANATNGGPGRRAVLRTGRSRVVAAGVPAALRRAVAARRLIVKEADHAAARETLAAVVPTAHQLSRAADWCRGITFQLHCFGWDNLLRLLDLWGDRSLSLTVDLHFSWPAPAVSLSPSGTPQGTPRPIVPIRPV